MSHVDVGDATHTSAVEYVSAYMHGEGASVSDNKDLSYNTILRKWLYYVLSPDLSGDYNVNPDLYDTPT